MSIFAYYGFEISNILLPACLVIIKVCLNILWASTHNSPVISNNSDTFTYHLQQNHYTGEFQNDCLISSYLNLIVFYLQITSASLYHVTTRVPVRETTTHLHVTVISGGMEKPVTFVSEYFPSISSNPFSKYSNQF